MCPKCGAYTNSFTNAHDVRVLELCGSEACGHVQVLWPEGSE